MPNFTDASKVLSTISNCDSVEYIRGSNRAVINTLFNGNPPLSPENAKKMGIDINVNWGDAPIAGQHGRRQYMNAFTSRSRYFKVMLPDAPSDKRTDWETFISNRINKTLKKSRQYYELHRSKWAAVLLHGIAPTMWYDSDDWLPCFVAIEDFRVPTDTMCSMENLCWFAIRKYYSPGELSKKAFGKYADKGWNKKVVQPILDAYEKQINSGSGSVSTSNFNWAQNPEKMAELYKQNGGYYSSDAVPTIPLWHFYYKEDADDREDKDYEGGWCMKVVPDRTTGVMGSTTTDFLYSENKPRAKKLEHLMQCQFGDLNNKAPFLVHSVRSMGFLMVEPCFWKNLTQCRFLQHVHEHMNVWMRISDAAGKARAQKVDLFNKGVVPDGVSIVPQAERHQIDVNMVDLAIDKSEAMIKEASVAWTQDREQQGAVEQTATQVMADVSSVNAMMSGLLNTAFNYQEFEYAEICRRFCIQDSENDEVKEFQSQCRKFGIPSRWLDSSLWDIQAEKPLGNGNPTMEMAQANALLGVRSMMGSDAQQKVLHEYVSAVTQDPRKAMDLVPLPTVQTPSEGRLYAELVFSTLMLGVLVPYRQELNPIDQIETLIFLLSGVISRIEQTTQVLTPSESAGIQTSTQYIQGLIQQLAQDKEQMARAKEYADTMGQLMNVMKQLEQSTQKAMQAQQQNGNGEQATLQAKLDAMRITAQSKAENKTAADSQKMHQKETDFVLSQQRLNDKTQADIIRQNAVAAAEIERKKDEPPLAVNGE